MRRESHRGAPAEAVVVLGCALRGGRPSPALRRRVERGIAVLREGAAPLLLLSGGGGEAAAMREVAVAAGIDRRLITVEDNSRDTFENARETARLLRARGLCRVVLVSDGYHLPRARLLFRAAGLTVSGTAAPPPRGLLREWPLYLREAAAWLRLGAKRCLRRAERR